MATFFSINNPNTVSVAKTVREITASEGRIKAALHSLGEEGVDMRLAHLLSTASTQNILDRASDADVNGYTTYEERLVDSTMLGVVFDRVRGAEDQRVLLHWVEQVAREFAGSLLIEAEKNGNITTGYLGLTASPGLLNIMRSVEKKEREENRQELF
jgi:hypothetical protein